MEAHLLFVNLRISQNLSWVQNLKNYVPRYQLGGFDVSHLLVEGVFFGSCALGLYIFRVFCFFIEFEFSLVEDIHELDRVSFPIERGVIRESDFFHEVDDGLDRVAINHFEEIKSLQKGELYLVLRFKVCSRHYVVVLLADDYHMGALVRDAVGCPAVHLPESYFSEALSFPDVLYDFLDSLLLGRSFFGTVCPGTDD